MLATRVKLGSMDDRLKRTWAWRMTMVLIAGVIAALCWVNFAPLAVGGRASYVVTDGISMLPRFKADGLVITRSHDAYHVGEVAAYHNQQLHVVVMHRIVAMNGNRYIFKGDNNNEADTYHATKSDIIGAEWTYWPGAGRYLNQIRNPITFAVIIGLIAMATFRVPRQSRRKRRHHA